MINQLILFVFCSVDTFRAPPIYSPGAAPMESSSVIFCAYSIIIIILLTLANADFSFLTPWKEHRARWCYIESKYEAETTYKMNAKKYFIVISLYVMSYACVCLLHVIGPWNKLVGSLGGNGCSSQLMHPEANFVDSRAAIVRYSDGGNGLIWRPYK